MLPPGAPAAPLLSRDAHVAHWGLPLEFELTAGRGQPPPAYWPVLYLQVCEELSPPSPSILDVMPGQARPTMLQFRVGSIWAGLR